jgi:5'-phosphate synthase pdxT subunit
VLATHNQEPVAVKFRNLMGASFHPELTGATHLHKLFISLVEEHQS